MTILKLISTTSRICRYRPPYAVLVYFKRETCWPRWCRLSSRIGKYSCQIGHSRFCFCHDAVFEPRAVISIEQISASTSGGDSTKQIESSVFLPSVFEDKENFGSDVADVITQRVNDACSKKTTTLESKFKELQDKYRTPQNCKFLYVPKMDFELWHHLSTPTKSKDLGMQEVQKNIVKPAQPLVQLFDSVPVAQNERKMLQPSEILPVIGDAIAFLGHASFLASLKRREFFETRYCSGLSVCLQQIKSDNNLSLWR